MSFQKNENLISRNEEESKIIQEPESLQHELIFDVDKILFMKTKDGEHKHLLNNEDNSILHEEEWLKKMKESEPAQTVLSFDESTNHLMNIDVHKQLPNNEDNSIPHEEEFLKEIQESEPTKLALSFDEDTNHLMVTDDVHKQLPNIEDNSTPNEEECLKEIKESEPAQLALSFDTGTNHLTKTDVHKQLPNNEDKPIPHEEKCLKEKQESEPAQLALSFDTGTNHLMVIDDVNKQLPNNEDNSIPHEEGCLKEIQESKSKLSFDVDKSYLMSIDGEYKQLPSNTDVIASQENEGLKETLKSELYQNELSFHLRKNSLLSTEANVHKHSSENGNEWNKQNDLATVIIPPFNTKDKLLCEKEVKHTNILNIFREEHSDNSLSVTKDHILIHNSEKIEKNFKLEKHKLKLAKRQEYYKSSKDLYEEYKRFIAPNIKLKVKGSLDVINKSLSVTNDHIVIQNSERIENNFKLDKHKLKQAKRQKDYKSSKDLYEEYKRFIAPHIKLKVRGSLDAKDFCITKKTLNSNVRKTEDVMVEKTRLKKARQNKSEIRKTTESFFSKENNYTLFSGHVTKGVKGSFDVTDTYFPKKPFEVLGIGEVSEKSELHNEAINSNLNSNFNNSVNYLSTFKVALVPNCYPNFKFSSDQCYDLKKALMYKLFYPQHKRHLILKFDGIYFYKGVCIINCLDLESKSWIESVVKNNRFNIGELYCFSFNNPKLFLKNDIKTASVENFNNSNEKSLLSVMRSPSDISTFKKDNENSSDNNSLSQLEAWPFSKCLKSENDNSPKTPAFNSRQRAKSLLYAQGLSFYGKPKIHLLKELCRDLIKDEGLNKKLESEHIQQEVSSDIKKNSQSSLATYGMLSDVEQIEPSNITSKIFCEGHLDESLSVTNDHNLAKERVTISFKRKLEEDELREKKRLKNMRRKENRKMFKELKKRIAAANVFQGTSRGNDYNLLSGHLVKERVNGSLDVTDIYSPKKPSEVLGIGEVSGKSEFHNEVVNSSQQGNLNNCVNYLPLFKLAVVPNCYPNVKFSSNQFCDLKKELMDKLFYPKHKRRNILKFDGIYFYQGICIISCLDLESKSWIENVVRNNRFNIGKLYCFCFNNPKLFPKNEIKTAAVENFIDSNEKSWFSVMKSPSDISTFKKHSENLSETKAKDRLAVQDVSELDIQRTNELITPTGSIPDMYTQDMFLPFLGPNISSFQNNDQPFQVFIVPSFYPEKIIDEKLFVVLKKAILSTLFIDSVNYPKFDGIYCYKGACIVNCVDEKTKLWLISAIKNDKVKKNVGELICTYKPKILQLNKQV